MIQSATSTLKVFRCSYNWQGRYSAYEEREVIVVESHESVALGRCLEQYGGDASNWAVEEIDQSVESIQEVSHREQ